MEKFKLILFTIVALGLMGLLGYWAVTTLQSGTEFEADEKIAELKKENKHLKGQVEDLTDQLANFEVKNEEPALVVKEEPAPKPATTTTTTTTKTTTYKNQTLINELQKLADDRVVLQLKDVGTKVGTIQKFLNVYNNTSNKVDNDFGESTKKTVIVFQKAQGLSADGGVGYTTINKMIAWLKKQG